MELLLAADEHYVEVDDLSGGRLRVHYLDVGPANGEVVLLLLLHGEPSWCYRYRHMIGVLVGAGLCCIAPDLIGFGRSDKPAVRSDYSYARHVEWMRATLFGELDLGGVTLVGHDWSGHIGRRLVAENPDRFARIVVASTAIFHVGEIVKRDCVGEPVPTRPDDPAAAVIVDFIAATARSATR